VSRLLKAFKMRAISLSLLAIIVASLFFGSCESGHQQPVFESIIKQAGLSPGKKLLVVVFINPECPITQKYTRTLNALSDSLSDNTFFVGVIPGKLFDDQKISDFKKAFAFKIPIIKDEQYTITRTLNANVYPEVVLLNQQSDKLYQGKIDNWYENVGVYRAVPSEFYLKDAINGYLQNGTIKISHTTAIGCFINYKNN
jgi:thiol-disulfide isomerase/thioredoxin